MREFFNGYGVFSGFVATITTMKIDEMLGTIVSILTVVYMIISVILKLKEFITKTKGKQD